MTGDAQEPTEREILLLRRIWTLETAVSSALGSGSWEDLAAAHEEGNRFIPPSPMSYLMLQLPDYDWTSPEASAATEAYMAELQIQEAKRDAYVKVMRSTLLITAERLQIRVKTDHVRNAADAAVWWMMGP